MGPIHFEERAGDGNHTQIIALQNAVDFGNLLGIEIDDVFVPQGAQLDESHAEFARGDLAGVSEILGELISNDGEFHRYLQAPRQTVTRQLQDSYKLRAPSSQLQAGAPSLI